MPTSYIEFFGSRVEAESEGVWDRWEGADPRRREREIDSVPSLTGGSQSVTDFTGQRANEKLVGCEARGQKLRRPPPFAATLSLFTPVFHPTGATTLALPDLSDKYIDLHTGSMEKNNFISNKSFAISHLHFVVQFHANFSRFELNRRIINSLFLNYHFWKSSNWFHNISRFFFFFFSPVSSRY